MNLIYLHGPPAAGKLTVARELLPLIACRILDNHASIDFGRVLFDFGTPEFWQLVEKVRFVAIELAAQSSLPNLICTACYSDPQDRAAFERLQAIVFANHGRLMPVYLRCDNATLSERISNPDRVERRKLTSQEGLAAFIAKWNIGPVPHAECFTVDTSLQTAVESANAICAHFGLEKGDTAGQSRLSRP